MPAAVSVQRMREDVREGGAIKTSPIAARYSVAAGCMATESLRNGSIPMIVPALDGELTAYFG